MSILIGSLPGVYVGSRLSSSAPALLVRPILVFVLVASALKLINLSNTALLFGLIVVALTLPSVWGLIDLARWKPEHWTRARQTMRPWAWLMSLGALTGCLGVVASAGYYVKVRRRLVSASRDEEGANLEPAL